MTAQPQTAKKAPAKKAAVKKASAKKVPRPPTKIASDPAPNFIANRRASFLILGRPSTMERPRNGRGHMYSPSASSVNELRQELQLLVSNCERPASQTTLFKREAKLLFQADFALAPRRGRRPDIDNLLKFVLDALNDSIWHDDGQVREVVMRLNTDAPPDGEFTAVTVTESLL